MLDCIPVIYFNMGVGRKRKFGLWSGILWGGVRLNTKQVEELTNTRSSVAEYQVL